MSEGEVDGEWGGVGGMGRDEFGQWLILYLNSTVAIILQEVFTFLCNISPFPLEQMDHHLSVWQCLWSIESEMTLPKRNLCGQNNEEKSQKVKRRTENEQDALYCSA